MDEETTRVAPSHYPSAAPPAFDDDQTDAQRPAAYDDVTEPEAARATPPPVPPPAARAAPPAVPPPPPSRAARGLGGRTLSGIAAVPPPPPLAQPAFAPDRIPEPGDSYPVDVDVHDEREGTDGVRAGKNVWRSSEYPPQLAEPGSEATDEPAAAEPPPMAPPPLLLDVTPQTLGVETVGGYCEAIIKRNAAIPVERTKIFTTAQDHQEIVRVRICQGESRRLVENQGLGEIVLTGLRIAPRGGVQIGVTFMISSDGTLGVRARDLATGQEQTIRINLVGGTSDAEIERMRARQAALLRPGSGG
jgi:molecular chaperone DnaK